VIIEQRKTLNGDITVPGDKSISHRAILIGSLAKGTTEIENFLLGEDCLSTIDCFRKMQTCIEILPGNKVRIQGKGLYGLKSPTSVLNTGKSGTSIRFLLGVLCGQTFTSTVIRDESAMKKPIDKVVAPLRQMGAIITGKGDGAYCPLSISPSILRGITLELTKLNTYIKSTILIAGLYANGKTSVIEAVKSRNHTELMLNCFGADIQINGLKATCHSVDNLYAQHVYIPGDISIASYFLTAGLLVEKSDVTIRDVGINPTRTGILEVYKLMGAKMEITNERTVSNERIADIHVQSSQLKAIKIEADMIPRLVDELPVIMVAATLAKGTTEITGLSGSKIKQSGRIKSLALELTKMGAHMHETDDGVIIEGGTPLKGTVVESYNNSSLAMALSVAGLVAENETMVRKSQVVDVAFPGFYELLNKL